MKRVVLLGGGGHARVVLEAMALIGEYTVEGYTDRRRSSGKGGLRVPCLGTDAALPALYRRGIRTCVVAVGSVADPETRVRLAEKAQKMGFAFATVIHPHAVVSPSAIVGRGVYIAPGAVINAGVRVGDHAIINTHACVDHDCRIGRFAHVGPGAVLSGGVVLGARAHVGTGASIRHEIRVGADAVIGVGSAVVSPIPGNTVAFGNPCRVVRRHRLP